MKWSEGKMVETTNFYSYMYARAGMSTFDELAEVADLSSPESIQRAFDCYLEEYTPPSNIKELLTEEKFYRSEGEGDDGNEELVRYDMSIPGMSEDIDKDALQNYFEDFLEKIGAENGINDKAVVEVELNDNERGGVDVDIYIAIGGNQIKKHRQD